MLPTRTMLAPSRRGAWRFELRYHGYRVLASFGNGCVELRTRWGANATRWFPEVVAALNAIDGGPSIVDGELCVLDALGRSTFAPLHGRAMAKGRYASGPRVTYVLFDLLQRHGQSMTTRPLEARREGLAECVARSASPHLKLIEQFIDQEQLLLRTPSCIDVPAIIAKHADGLYLPGMRSPDWVSLDSPRSSTRT